MIFDLNIMGGGGDPKQKKRPEKGKRKKGALLLREKEREKGERERRKIVEWSKILIIEVSFGLALFPGPARKK